jgi:UDPglucose 6-dehydrogenase
MVKKIEEAMGNLKEKAIGVLGITFKPNTCDMREAPSLVILDRLVRDGANIRIYDTQKVRKKGNGD